MGAQQIKIGNNGLRITENQVSIDTMILCILYSAKADIFYYKQLLPVFEYN